MTERAEFTFTVKERDRPLHARTHSGIELHRLKKVTSHLRQDGGKASIARHDSRGRVRAS
jgi:hypothetical protein